MKISIIYWSGTGNTETMAELIKEGAESNGAEVLLKTVAEANAEDALEADVLVLGCPAHGTEELEMDEFEPFLESIESDLSGKKVALFGSYGWGGGAWLETWREKMEGLGIQLINDGLAILESPDSDGEEACKEFGAEVSK